MIFEARNFSYVSKDSLIDLYGCYFYSGEIGQGKKTLFLLEKKYSDTLDMDDCIRVAEIAEHCKLMTVSSKWYEKAESFISKSISIDDIYKSIE